MDNKIDNQEKTREAHYIFFPIEEVNNCFQVINQGVDKCQICKNTTGSSETTFATYILWTR